MFLPLFPLRLVVFPGEELRLHIFEPRYRQLLAEAREHGMPFGIPAYLEDALAAFGTSVALRNVTREYDDGRLDVVVTGEQAFRLVDFQKEVDGKLYSGGEVEFIRNDAEPGGASRAELISLYTLFHTLIESGRTRERFDLPNLSFQLAQESGLTLEQKVELLGMPRETDRLDFLTRHLREVIPILKGAAETKRRIRGNGHFKKMPEIDL